MKIDLAQKSKELKDFVSQFETSMFLGDISSLIQFIRFDSPTNSLNGLSSLYFAAEYISTFIVSERFVQKSDII